MDFFFEKNARKAHSSEVSFPKVNFAAWTLARDHLLSQYNSNSSLCLFHAIWLAGEYVLHLDKFDEQESRNHFP